MLTRSPSPAASARLAVPAQITAPSKVEGAVSAPSCTVTVARLPSVFTARTSWPYRQRTPSRSMAAARPLVNLWMSPVESLSVK
ncbi:hypothetical protein D9M72_555530 [compost metagenome]